MRVTPNERPVPLRPQPAPRRSFEEALERTSAGAAPPPPLRPSGLALPELREAVRAVPPAIWAGRLAGAGSVELAFGRELAVELRQGEGGVEVVVRAQPGLVRAARVDLPALVVALRERGVKVVRAEVRGRSRGAASLGEGERGTARIRTGE